MTIIEAIKIVLAEQASGMTVDQIYKNIIEKDLYTFNAKNPKGVVNGEIRRHCLNLDFPTASHIKHFYIEKTIGKKFIFKVLTDNIQETKKTAHKEIVSADILPEEKVEHVVNEYNNNVKELLIQKIMNNAPSFFEQLVVELLYKMGYGYDKSAGQVVGRSHDGGIDGIISEDKLGLDLIYIQAKRYDKGNNVGRKDLQAFVGAMEGVNKGVFFTTSKFSKEAEEYVNKIQHKSVRLVNGNKLCELMLKYGVGVQILKTYNLFKVDEDFFVN